MKRDKIAILIPCYNEAKTIERVVTGFKKNLKQATIYVYDNNSTDNTTTIAKKTGAIVRREPVQGKGNVVRRMFREIDADCYIIIDGDNTYAPESSPEMARQIIEEKADMVIGDRLSTNYFKENKRPFHNLGNIFMRNSINFLFHSDVKDILTGYRAFSYNFVKTFPVISKGFEIETEMSIHAIVNNMLIKNYPIEYHNREKGSESKLHTFSDGIKTIHTVAKLYRTYKPLKFFGYISFFLALLSICLFIPVFFSYLETGLVAQFPTLIVSGFIMIAAIQSFFAGLILQTILHKNRQDFEIYLNLINKTKHKN